MDHEPPPAYHEADDVAAVARTTAALLTAVNSSDLRGVIGVWADDGIMMPPHRPAVSGRPSIERYFEQLFRDWQLQFTFPVSHIHLSGDIAVECVEYEAVVRSIADRSERRDVGKGVHVLRRQPDGTWKLAMDIWNSNVPLPEEGTDDRRRVDA